MGVTINKKEVVKTAKGRNSKFDIFSLQATDYELRTEMLNGREHWVVPVIMMVEGVHHGSRGPLLYTSEELGEPSWNGIPITIQHPQTQDGAYVSANLPQFIESVVGRIYNSHMEGTKLKADAYIDTQRLREISEEAFESIKERGVLDVSVGVFSDEHPASGVFNGEDYRAEARNLRPDHLALLPGGRGACSWDDGCGVRVNEETKSKTMANKDKAAYLAALLETISNDEGFREIMQKIQSKLNAMDNGVAVYYLEELYDDNFVYRVVNRESGESYFRRNYSVQEDGGVEFTADPVRVKKEVSFVNVNSQKLTRTNFNNNKHEASMKTNAKATPCSVDALIKNEATKFTEEDRTWLSALSQEQLDKLAPGEEAPKANAAPAKEKKEEEPAANSGKEKEQAEVLVKKNDDGTISINGKSLDELVRESFSKEKDVNKFIDNFMPEGMRDQMKSALKAQENKRKELVEGIVSNSSFKAEELNGWKEGDLEKLYQSLVPKGDYSPLGANFRSGEHNAADVEELAAMLSFESPRQKAEEKK